MKTAKEVFASHLDYLREIAAEKNVHLADILSVLVGTTNHLARLMDTLNDPDVRVISLTRRYRLQFYEWLPDEQAKILSENWDLYKLNPEKVAEAVKGLEQRRTALDSGRKKGAIKQKTHAAEIWRDVEKMNSDLLQQANSARWNLDVRADHIKRRLKQDNRLQPNGKPYSASTIKKKITGKG